MSKEKTRIVYGFSITLKLDSIVLETVRFILHIKTIIRCKSKYNYLSYIQQISRAGENIIVYFKNSLIGTKSPEYKI